MAEKDAKALGKKARNLKRRQDMLANVKPQSAAATLNTAFSIAPPAFDSPKARREIRQSFSAQNQPLNLFQLNMTRLHRFSNGKKAAIFAPPKTGSTFVLSGIERLPEYKFAISYIHVPYSNPSFVDADLRENELDELALLRLECLGGNIVTQAHMKCSPYSERFLNAYHYKPIIVRRNIFDCVVSMDDMICKGQMPGFAMVRPPISYRTWEREKRLDYLCRMVGPWYVDFYVSWQRSRLSPLVLDYHADVRGFDEQTAGRIHEYLGLTDLTAQQVHDSFVIKDDTRKSRARFNVGITGRGRDIPQAARQTVLDIAEFYIGDVDLSSVLS